jgi:hypothetical protein
MGMKINKQKFNVFLLHSPAKNDERMECCYLVTSVALAMLIVRNNHSYYARKLNLPSSTISSLPTTVVVDVSKIQWLISSRLAHVVSPSSSIENSPYDWDWNNGFLYYFCVMNITE